MCAHATGKPRDAVSPRYSLKAACSHCNAYGTVDDQTLICAKCGNTHTLTPSERQAHDEEIAFVQRVRPDLLAQVARVSR